MRDIAPLQPHITQIHQDSGIGSYHPHPIIHRNVAVGGQPAAQRVRSRAERTVFASSELAAPAQAPQHATVMRSRVVVVRRLVIEFAQRIHDVVKSDREEAVAGRLPQRRRVLAARIRRPRRQDRALLVERQIRVLDHLTRIRKGAAGRNSASKSRGPLARRANGVRLRDPEKRTCPLMGRSARRC